MAGEERVARLVKPSVDHVCRLKFPSGNYPPCVGDTRDQLVHWCHGSPGVVYMLLQAYKVHPGACLNTPTSHPSVSPSTRLIAVGCVLSVPSRPVPRPQVFGVAQYLEDAVQCGEVVWQRGLLKKGYGLCHGAAGNAYTFLALYKLTHHPRHLYRACMVRRKWLGDSTRLVDSSASPSQP